VASKQILQPTTAEQIVRNFLSHLKLFESFLSSTFFHNVFETVTAASLSIASRGGASPQKFEKRALTIFRQEPDPYESAHQLDCSFLFPTAMANGTGRYNNFLLSDPTNNKHQRRLIVSTVSETQQKQTKSFYQRS